MNNISRVIVILASLAALVAIVWLLTREPSAANPPAASASPSGPAERPADLAPGESAVIEVEPDPTRNPAVNEPDKILNVRRPDHVYDTTVVAQTSGEAESKDWGFRGAAKFNLTWTFRSVGEVVSNDGRTIVERRTFQFDELLTVDSVRAGLSLTESQAWIVAGVVGVIGEAIAGGSTFGGQITAAKQGIDAVNGTMWEVSGDWLELASRAAEQVGLPEVDLKNGLRLMLPRPEFAILDGKTVTITFEDGKGITRLEAVGCTLSPHERQVITRTNNLADHYIFPDKTRAVGESWQVPADNLGSIVDPRLRGVIVSKGVRLRRIDDGIEEGGGRILSLTIDGPQRVTLAKSDDGTEVTGELQLDEATFELPDSAGVVTAVEASGSAEYRERSTDHLLFEAEFRSRPSFTAYGKTTVRKK